MTCVTSRSNGAIPVVRSQRPNSVAWCTSRATRWAQAPQRVFVPPPRDEAAIAQADGAKLFAGAPDKEGKMRVECMKCHGPTALGDGASAFESFDEWNKPKWNLRDPEVIAQRFNLPLQRLQPRNLRLGIYRGGRRPVDLFRRIALGIFPSAMPAHAAIGADGKMSTSDPGKLQSLAEATGGSSRRIGQENGSGVAIPRIVPVRSGRQFAGADWIGLRISDSGIVRGVSISPLFVGLIGLAILFGALVAGWIGESGRRFKREG